MRLILGYADDIANSTVPKRSRKLWSKLYQSRQQCGFRGATKPLFNAAPTQHSSTCILKAALSCAQIPTNKGARISSRVPELFFVSFLSNVSKSYVITDLRFD